MMAKDEISPALLALLDADTSGESRGGRIPLPPDMVRRRKEWKIYASQLDLVKPSIPRAGLRLAMAAGIAAAILMLGTIGFLIRQQASLARQLAQTEAELKAARNAREVKASPPPNDAEIAAHWLNQELRELRQRNDELTEQLRTPINKRTWPPLGMVLTGTNPEGSGFSFIAWLRRSDERQYGGFVLPIPREGMVGRAFAAEGKLGELDSLTLSFSTDKPLGWPFLAEPNANAAQANVSPPTRVEANLKIDISGAKFTGRFDKMPVSGKVSY